jgi:hypothetical protein
VVHRLTVPDAGEHAVFLGQPVVWNNHRDRPADGFFGGEPEHALGGAIPRRNHALEILPDDGIVGRFHNRHETKGRKIG